MIRPARRVRSHPVRCVAGAIRFCVRSGPLSGLVRSQNGSEGGEVGEGATLERFPHRQAGALLDGDDVRDGQGATAGGERRGDAGRGVLDGDATSGVDIDQRCGCEVGIGSGFAVRDLVAGDRTHEHAVRSRFDHGVGEAAP